MPLKSPHAREADGGMVKSNCVFENEMNRGAHERGAYNRFFRAIYIVLTMAPFQGEKDGF